MDGRIDIITCYFEMGLCQRDILFALAVNNGIVMSITTLKRIMQTARLYRRKNYSDATEIVLFVQKQVEKHGGLFGYRWMHTKCLENGLTVSRSEIAMIMQTIDPEGIALRRQRRLRRREYFAKGPNFVWHIDGWDKLKPYGVAVHGCVDGFSRHIIWLEAHWTNNQPRLIGGYYIKAVARLGGCPRIVRADNGTENGHVCAIQQYLRRNDRDSFAGEKSFLYGRSTANQRIEFLWGMLRKQCMQTWMDLFTTLSDDGHFCGDELDKALVQFCFMDIIQVTVNEFTSTWDNHTIRSSNHPSLAGKPRVLYALPELYSCDNHLSAVDSTEIVSCADECVSKDELRGDKDLTELLHIVMTENDLIMAHDALSATQLYKNVRAKVRALLT